MDFFKPRPNVQELERRADVEGLTKALRYRRDADVRLAAAAALGRIDDISAVEPLIRALSDKFIRWEAAAALERIGAPAIEGLRRALTSEDTYVQQAAKRTLENIGATTTVSPD